jgi:hypothetical protein
MLNAHWFNFYDIIEISSPMQNFIILQNVLGDQTCILGQRSATFFTHGTP